MMYIYGIPQHIILAHHALKKQVGWFNHGLVILVVAKLKRQRLLVRGFRDYCNLYKATKETAILYNTDPTC